MKTIVLFLIASLASVAAAFIWLGVRGALIDTQGVKESFARFVALEGRDEYVLAELTSSETFTARQMTTLLKRPIGETVVQLTLVADYKYFVRLGGLSIDVRDDTVLIHSPTLHLSTPVAFDSATLQKEVREDILGPRQDKLYDSLLLWISGELKTKGETQAGAVYDKAAKALAENFHRYLSANGYGRAYTSIAVDFADEPGSPRRQFDFSGARPAASGTE